MNPLQHIRHELTEEFILWITRTFQLKSLHRTVIENRLPSRCTLRQKVRDKPFSFCMVFMCIVLSILPLAGLVVGGLEHPRCPQYAKSTLWLILYGVIGFLSSCLISVLVRAMAMTNIFISLYPLSMSIHQLIL